MQDLWLMAIVDGVVIVLMLLFYRQFEALSFDVEFAKVRGINTSFFSLSFNRTYGILHSDFYTPCGDYFDHGFT